MSLSTLNCVILSGGAGTRLWPVSREAHPKPFMKLADGTTLIQRTYARAKALCSQVLTVTNSEYYFTSQDEMHRAGVSGNFLLEPFGRNTAPAIALASKYISATQGSDALMLVLPADHLITDLDSFRCGVADASNLARKGYLVTFGIVPTSPETGFGYIEKGEGLVVGNRVARFVEKPDLSTAKGYVSSDKYLWNSGMFCFEVGALLEELGKTAPAVIKAVESCWQAMQPLENPQMISPTLFKTTPDISIDYAVMEKSDKVAVIQGNFGWNDIGSWKAIRDLVPADDSMNRAIGDVIFVDSKNTFVQSEDRLVATVGISDLIIVETSDALLVAHQDNAQDVKKVVAHLKNDDHQSFKLHRTVVRPWGTYTVLQESSDFKIKRIEVKPGASLSLQMHHHRSEHWVVVNGTAKITNGDSVILVASNESTYIPVGQRHRLENPGIIPCVLIEIQCGPYLGEDDIVRFDDKYGR